MCEFCDSYENYKPLTEKTPVYSRITVEPILGHIEDCIQEAIDYAKNNKDSYTLYLKFNGVDLPVKAYKKGSYTDIEIRRLTDIYDDYKKARLIGSFND